MEQTLNTKIESFNKSIDNLGIELQKSNEELRTQKMIAEEFFSDNLLLKENVAAAQREIESLQYKVKDKELQQERLTREWQQERETLQEEREQELKRQQVELEDRLVRELKRVQDKNLVEVIELEQQQQKSIAVYETRLMQAEALQWQNLDAQAQKTVTVYQALE